MVLTDKDFSSDCSDAQGRAGAGCVQTHEALDGFIIHKYDPDNESHKLIIHG